MRIPSKKKRIKNYISKLQDGNGYFEQIFDSAVQAQIEKSWDDNTTLFYINECINNYCHQINRDLGSGISLFSLSYLNRDKCRELQGLLVASLYRLYDTEKTKSAISIPSIISLITAIGSVLVNIVLAVTSCIS